MPLTPNDSQSLAKLTGEVTRVVNTIDDLMDLLADSGGQGADIWAAIAAHNSSPDAHGALIADKVNEAVDGILDNHNEDPEAHKDVIAGAVGGALDAHNANSNAHKAVIKSKIDTHNDDPDAHKDLFTDAAVPAATSTVAGKVTLATANDKTDTSKVPPAAVVQGWLADVGGMTTQTLITTSETWTVPKNGVYLFTLVGGGGAGGSGKPGGGIAPTHYGGGGGGGAVTRYLRYLAAGDMLTITIGAGGTGAGITSYGGGQTSISIPDGTIFYAGGGGAGGKGSDGGTSGGGGGGGGLFEGGGSTPNTLAGGDGGGGPRSGGGSGGATASNGTSGFRSQGGSAGSVSGTGGQSFHGFLTAYGQGGKPTNANSGLSGTQGCVAIYY